MLTGRDLIIYILENNLEDEPIYNEGRLIGFMNVVEAAVKWNVGAATIFAWLEQGQIEGVIISGGLLIPSNCKSPLEDVSI